jgi:hypothetical protein
MIHSEGDETSWKILAVCQFLLTLAESEKIGNTSDGDTLVGWSPPGIACERMARGGRGGGETSGWV